jgi:hypothetical protein
MQIEIEIGPTEATTSLINFYYQDGQIKSVSIFSHLKAVSLPRKKNKSLKLIKYAFSQKYSLGLFINYVTLKLVEKNVRDNV